VFQFFQNKRNGGLNIHQHIKILSKKGNAAAAILGLVFIAALFIAFFVTVKPFAMIYDKFGDSNYAGLSQEQCGSMLGTWYGGSCHQLDERAGGLLPKIRFYWLLAPIIFAIGIFIWIFSVATKKDPQFYQGGGPLG
jgi:hypothetical protein